MQLTHPTTGQWQQLDVYDLAACPRQAGLRADVVYSDPPWNPGNAKYWRTHARVRQTESDDGYQAFLKAWCREVIAYHPASVLVEQSANWGHASMLLAAAEDSPGWRWPLLEHWEIQYGHPRRPNRLLHFGTRRLESDPSGMSGEAMTRAVFDGLRLTPGMVVADPCMGLGTTSRVAHAFGLHCAGTELNPKRLARTIEWLRRHGYRAAK